MNFPDGETLDAESDQDHPSSRNIVGEAAADRARAARPRRARISPRHTLLIIAAASACFAVWRSLDLFVWDDTGAMAANAYDVVNTFHRTGSYSLSHLSALFAPFSQFGGAGYFPIEGIFSAFGDAFNNSDGKHTAFYVFLTIDAVIFGLTAAALISFARTATVSRWGPYGVAFLLFSSTPFLTAGLILFNGSQTLAMLMILLILMAYRRCKDHASPRWIAVLVLLLIIAPWVRVETALAPAMIVASEILNYRRIRLVSVLGLIGLAHAVYPTVGPDLFWRNLPILPTWKFGDVGTAVNAMSGPSSVTGKIAALHWRIFGDIFSVMSPTLTLIGVLGTAWILANRKDRTTERYRTDLWLALSFLIAFVPLLELFREQVHLFYALFPLSILIVRRLEDWASFATARLTKVATVILGAVLLVTGLDQATNLVSVRQATSAIYSPIVGLAGWLQANVPAGTIVISNAHVVEDVQFYADGRIDPWATVTGLLPDPRHGLDGAAALNNLLSRRGDRQDYFLDVRVPGPTHGQPSATTGRALVWVEDHEIAVKEVGPSYRVRYIYPYFDPLRWLLPTEVATWPGPPDLESDFYRGPSFAPPIPFWREVAADYTLYLITGSHVPLWAPYPSLLVSGFHGFNLVGFQDTVYAIPQTAGPFDISRIDRHGYAKEFQGPDVATVEKEALASVGKTPSWTQPSLLVSGFHGFNLVGFQDTVYAIPQTAGPFDISRIDRHGYAKEFQGPDVSSVEREVLASLRA